MSKRAIPRGRTIFLVLHVFTILLGCCCSISTAKEFHDWIKKTNLHIKLPNESDFNDTLLVDTNKPSEPFNSTVIRVGYLNSLERKRSPDYSPPGRLISGAFTYAVEKINKDPDILPNHTLVYEIAETYGEEEDSIRETALFIQNGIHAIFGPQETCVHEGRIAAAFNVPMISYYCTDAAVSDPDLYPTFARTKPTDSQISGSAVSILKLFGWNRVTFIHNQGEEYNITADTIYELMLTHGIRVTHRRTYKGPYFHTHQLNPFIKIVSETRHDTRIYLMLADPYEFVGLMEHLQDLGLLDTGDYFVVGVTRDTYDIDKPLEFLQGIFDQKVTNQSMLAYRHFLSIIHTPPLDPKYKEFKETVDHYLELPPFNLPNIYKNANGTRDIRPEAVYLYDAVHIYARVVHQILLDGKDPRDGRELIGRIQGMEYKSAFGFLSKINDKGDALGNFSVIARKHIKEKWGMYPVGTFRLDPDGGPLPEFHFHKGETIRWINGAPPLDEPKCGFHNERCIPGETYTTEIAGTVVGGIIFLIIIIGYIVYNNWRYEQELAGLLWKIDYYKDLEFKTHSFNGNSNPQCSKSPLRKSASQSSLISATDVDLRQLFTHVGIYKGTLVAVKHLNKTHVELSRSTKKELKTVKELRHDNINPFIGACVEPMQIAIVTSYCHKGSLQDILENEDIQLDSMFIASLIFDIIKGMIYLHGSEIISHGRLKSSNCVVDSRWVLKITDYGLHGFTAGGQQPQGEYAFYRNLLWRAPELLRCKNSRPRGSQEGDVYSFAILLFEIQSRNGPYGQCELSPKEIVERVASVNVTGQAFRPRLSEISSTPKFITDVIYQSWHEDPCKRPDFKSLRTMLKPMQKGLKSNILDNMVAMMEKYASNLESLIQSRTDELIEEKKKTEELLQDMLPGTVADQLMHGKQVEAEGFDEVTIYFSDICGFTALSAQSTPMQIVELLNSLYTLFDSLIDFYDVYKVETIGDAYMVVSGLPKRNGIKHAGEIASMSLNLLQELSSFKIPHRDDDRIMLRIGIHTGPVVAGVVGRKMPRYCLFGDTVNVASRMESNGQPSKIHLSEPTMTLLLEIGGFELQERGYIDVKGKGLMRTYWLMGEDPSRNHQRLQRGMARMERSSSTRRRNKDGVLRADGSPQLSHNSHLIKSQSGGNYPLESPSFRNQNHLHPFSHIVGPTSHDLIRRTSSRRRRLQFQLKNEVKDESSSGDDNDLGPPEFTAETLPTIIRSKSEKDCCDLDDGANTRTLSKSPPILKAASDYSLTNHSDTSEVILADLCNDIKVESPSLNNFMYNPPVTTCAPLFKIESFDGDVLLDSESYDHVNSDVPVPPADNISNISDTDKNGHRSSIDRSDLVNALQRVNGISNSSSNSCITNVNGQDNNSDNHKHPTVPDKPSPPQYSSLYPHSLELQEVVSQSHNSLLDRKSYLDQSYPCIENNKTLSSHSQGSLCTSQHSPNSLNGKGSFTTPVHTERTEGSFPCPDKPLDEVNTEGTPLLSDHDGFAPIHQRDTYA